MEDNRKRTMERRRETSRFAARDRRGKEADIFNDLKDVVPIVEEGTVTHLDRIALLRVAAAVCRLRQTAGNVLKNDLKAEITDAWNEDMITECLDGFVIIADSDGSILYITESVALYLGLSQTDLTGRSLKDFFEQRDYDEFLTIAGQLCTLCTRNGQADEERNVVLRMKTVISPRGRCLNLKSALYKAVSFQLRARKSDGGHVILMQGVTIPAGQGNNSVSSFSVNRYSDTPTGTFMTRHTCDMKISYIMDRFNYIQKTDTKNLMGSSFYDLVHPADAHIVASSMKELFQKGHVRTPYYRMISSPECLAWVQTEATTIAHTTKGQRGQYVICVHFVLGLQSSEESLIICTDAVPAGMQVYIKKEIEDNGEYVGRQPEIVDCVDFTPLLGAEDVFDMEEARKLSEKNSTVTMEEPPSIEENDDAVEMNGRTYKRHRKRKYSVSDEDHHVFWDELDRIPEEAIGCYSLFDEASLGNIDSKLLLDEDMEEPKEKRSKSRSEEHTMQPKVLCTYANRSIILSFCYKTLNMCPSSVVLSVDLKIHYNIIYSIKYVHISGERKNSFDDVLQWLFRDQPSSPPPCISGKGQRKPQALDGDPSLASLQFMDPPTGRSSVAGMSVSRQHDTSSSLSAQPASLHMRPHHQHVHHKTPQSCCDSNSPSGHSESSLTDGFGAQCGLHSPRDPAAAAGDVVNGVAGPAAGQSRDLGIAMRSMDHGCGPSDRPRCLSTLPPSDAIPMQVNRMGMPERQGAYMFTSLPAPSDPVGETPTTNQQSQSINYAPTIICDDIQWEEPDLTGLAPFVDNTEMEQITEGLPPELQHLFSMPDWTPAEPMMPAARPVKLENENNKCERMSPPAKRQPPQGYYPSPPQFNMTSQQPTTTTSYWPWQEQEQLTPFGSTFPQNYVDSQQQ